MHRFQYKAYRRPLALPFSNARETLSRREGLIARLEDRDGRVGFGEAAPMLSFGTESFPSCLAAAEGIGASFQWEKLRPELRSFPCLLWALESALDGIEREGAWPPLTAPLPVCALVAELGDRAEIEERLQLNYRCLKFKVGKADFEDELRALEWVLERTGGAIGLRLDANGSLSARQAAQWLERAAQWPVEFLEQPLPVGEEREMRRLGEEFPTPLALDESARSVDDLKRWRDQQWPGLLVIKPSLAGSLFELREELAHGVDDCVFSSSLESKVGAANAIGFALAAGATRRALGFGVERLFSDRNAGLELGPFLQNGVLPDSDELQSLWNLI